MSLNPTYVLSSIGKSGMYYVPIKNIFALIIIIVIVYFRTHYEHHGKRTRSVQRLHFAGLGQYRRRRH